MHLALLCYDKRVDEPCTAAVNCDVDTGAGAYLSDTISIGMNVLTGPNAVMVGDGLGDWSAIGTPAEVISRNLD